MCTAILLLLVFAFCFILLLLITDTSYAVNFRKSKKASYLGESQTFEDRFELGIVRHPVEMLNSLLYLDP